MPVFPDRRMFRLHDATVDPDAPGSPLPPDGALISVTREQLWVASLQEVVSVQLLLEEWDAAPPPSGEKWEDEAKAVLYLRGAVSIDMGTAGKAVDNLNLAEVTHRYRDLLRGLDPLSDDFEQARRSLDGLEQYLLQLWRGS